MEDMQESNHTDFQENQRCKIHNKKLKIYCIDKYCSVQEKRLCSKCLLKNELHSQHEALELDDTNNLWQENIEELNERINQLKDQDKELLDQLIQQIKSSFKNISVKLLHLGEQIIELMSDKFQREQYFIDDKTIQEFQQKQFNQLIDNDDENQDLIQKILNNTDSFLNIQPKVKEQWRSVLSDFSEICECEMDTYLNKMNLYKEKLALQLKTNFQCEVFKEMRSSHKRPINQIISVGQNMVATASDEIRFWDTVNYDCVNLIKIEAYQEVTSILQQNEEAFIAGFINGEIKFYDEFYKFQFNVVQHTDRVSGLFKINENQFLSASFDSYILHWNIEGEVLLKYKGHKAELYKKSISFIPQDEHVSFVSCGHDNMIMLWKGYIEEPVYQVELEDELACTIKVIEKTQKFITGHQTALRIWNLNEDLDAFECIKILNNVHLVFILDIHIFHQEYLITASEDWKLKVWKLDLEKNDIGLVQCFGIHMGHVNGVCLANEQKQIISVSDDKTMIIYQ